MKTLDQSCQSALHYRQQVEGRQLLPLDPDSAFRF
jgi:hypothetical protein